ncbi:MAG TPA: hypothetical protein VF379_00695 [Gaiellaceae bacterium]
MQNRAIPGRYAKYATISAGGGVLGVIVARSTWFGIPLAVACFALAAFLLWKAFASLPRPTTEESDASGDDGP